MGGISGVFLKFHSILRRGLRSPACRVGEKNNFRAEKVLGSIIDTSTFIIYNSDAVNEHRAV